MNVPPKVKSSVKNFASGLLLDTRCNILPRNSLIVDYECDGKPPISTMGEWSGFLLLKLEKHFITNFHVGYALKWKNFGIDFFLDHIQFWDFYKDHRVLKIKFDGTKYRESGEWFVLTFVLVGAGNAPKCYINNQIGVNIPTNANHPEAVHMAGLLPALPGFVTLGDSEFDGSLARFVLYNRIVTNKELEFITWEFQHPHIVEVRARTGHYVDNVKFVFSDCTVKSYGGKGGYLSKEPLTLRGDDRVIGFGIDSTSCRYFANYIKVITKHDENTPWIVGGSHEKNEIRWDEYICNYDSEVIGLNVSFEERNEGECKVHGITHDVTCKDYQKMQCSNLFQQHYLDELQKIKDLSILVVEQYGWHKSEIPTIRDWDHDAKMKWWKFLCKVRLEPKHFLNKYLISSGYLHISASSIVVSATEKYEDRNERGSLWKERPVAMKFVKTSDQVVNEVNGRSFGESYKHIVPITAVIVDANQPKKLTFDMEKVLVYEEIDLNKQFATDVLTKVAIVPDKDKDKLFEQFECNFCIVLELGERNLTDVLVHENIAGTNWHYICEIMRDVCNALSAVHKSNRIHGDVKPLNIVRVGGKWKLIDMDVSCQIMGNFGTKLPSTGYCPPEMARAILALSPNDKASSIIYKANISHDLWSIGCVFYELVFGRTLFPTDINGNITNENMTKLGSWTIDDCYRKLLEKMDMTNDFQLARNLLLLLLHPLPSERMNSLTGMELILRHPFLIQHSESMTADIVEQIVRASAMHIITEVNVHTNQCFEALQKRLNENFNILSHVFREVSSTMPYLVLFLPMDKEKSKKKFIFPVGHWLSTTVRLFFVDPVSLSRAKTNGNNGFPIEVPRAWFVTALPWIKVSLTALKVATIAGRLTGIPIPDIPGEVQAYIEKQIMFLSSLKSEFIDKAAALTHDRDLAERILKDVDGRCAAHICSILENTSPVVANHFNFRTNKIVQFSMDSLVTMLPHDWRGKCGLKLVVSGEHGGSADWILEQYENEYIRKGRSVLGTKGMISI